tara:strand:+ start:3926 stop:4780 length:855 start_codon:yes stop_codon:yes gene_type:complete
MSFFKNIFDSLQSIAAKKKSPKFILTIWIKSQLNKDWTMYVQGFDVLSVKICDGGKSYKKKNAAEIVAIADELNKEAHGWGFHYCESVEDAKKEAEVAAGLCEELSLSGYHWNAEKQWAGSEDPDTYAIAFAETFKLHAPNVSLFANCFSAPVSKEMMEHFDYYEPMIYGTRISTIATKFQKRFSAPSIPKSKRCAMVGTGRKNTKNPKQAWGYVKSTGRDVKQHGLDKLIPSFKPVYVNFFRAGLIGKEDIMVEPNDINPVLSEQIRIIKAGFSGELKNVKGS